MEREVSGHGPRQVNGILATLYEEIYIFAFVFRLMNLSSAAKLCFSFALSEAGQAVLHSDIKVKDSPNLVPHRAADSKGAGGHLRNQFGLSKQVSGSCLEASTWALFIAVPPDDIRDDQ